MTAAQLPGHITVTEAARRMGCDSSVVRRMINRGFLPAIRPNGWWYVAEDVIDRLCAYHRLPGRPSKAARLDRARVHAQLADIAERSRPAVGAGRSRRGAGQGETNLRGRSAVRAVERKRATAGAAVSGASDDDSMAHR